MNENEQDRLKAALAEGMAEEEAQEARAAETERTPEERGERLGEELEAQATEHGSGADAASAAEARDRKTHRGIVIAVVAFAVLLIGAGIAYNAMAPSANREVEVTGTDAVHGTEVDATGDTGEGENASTTTPAPDFTMVDSQGKTLQLSDFKGKPVLLNFWASWCGPCQSEMPDIQQAWEQYGQEIDFLIVNMTGMSGETEQTAKAFLTDEGYTFPAYFDKDNSAAAAFGVSSIPQTYLIDAEGNILGSYMGSMTSQVIDEGIQLLTNGTPAPAAQ